jgi:cell wall-associated NlpC family hydrolase
MTSRAAIARHRAEVQRSAQLSTIARAVSENSSGVGRQAAVIAAASGLVLTTGVAASAAEPMAQREANTTELKIESVPVALEVPADAKVAFNRTPVSAVAAPAIAEPAEVKPAADTVEAEPVAAQAGAAASVSVQSAPAKKTAAPSGMAATIAAAAQAQVGVMQDCTRLVSNALAAAGINFHGWPAGYLSLGRTVSAAEAVPGDLLYYQDGGMGVAHIAVYIGNGQAVHGGWNGNQTVTGSAYVGSGPVFIRVGG